MRQGWQAGGAENRRRSCRGCAGGFLRRVRPKSQATRDHPLRLATVRRVAKAGRWCRKGPSQVVQGMRRCVSDGGFARTAIAARDHPLRLVVVRRVAKAGRRCRTEPLQVAPGRRRRFPTARSFEQPRRTRSSPAAGGGQGGGKGAHFTHPKLTPRPVPWPSPSRSAARWAIRRGVRPRWQASLRASARPAPARVR